LSYFDDYKDRLVSKGTTIGEAYGNATIDLINQMFTNSPLYKIVPIDSVDTEVRVLADKNSSIKTLIFRPRTKFDKGSIVTLESLKWLMTDFDNNDIYPKAAIAKCNDTLKWKPSDGVIREHPCVISGFSSSFSFGFAEDKQMKLPTGELHIFVNYNTETLGLKLGTRLIFGSKIYKLAAIDDLTDVLNGKGVLKLYIKMDIISEKDNFSTGIAENGMVNNSKQGGW
jgi:hypothetical protein